MSHTTITEGNHRVVVFDPDEPIEGYKKKTWLPPAEWGPYEVDFKSVTRDSKGKHTAMSVPYESLHFAKVNKDIYRLTRPCHGYDTEPTREQPDFNADDLCP